MYRVTCGVIRNDNEEILVVQRGAKSDHPGKWEFPGGKVEEGESDEDCLIREIDEELGMDIIICAKLPEVYYDYGFKQIKLVPFVCDTLDEKPSLTEHKDYRWTSAQELMGIEFCEADIKVAEHYLSKYKGSSAVVEPPKPVSIEPTDYSADIH